MGSDDQKHGNNSETSSDQETTSRSMSPNSTKDGLGRSYECNFCKRGFTNAQALGGHMNIHRKDKAKAKLAKQYLHNTTFSTTTPSPNKQPIIIQDLSMLPSRSFNLNPNEESQHLGSSFGYQFIPSNPNFQWSFAASQFDHNRTLHEEGLMRVNLDLGIGTSEMENVNIESATSKIGDDEDWTENDDVDLELRLGHYP